MRATLQKKLDKLKARQNKLDKDKEELITQTQNKCKHPANEIVEGDYRSYQYLDRTDPPFRVCRACGYAEEGWGCGYWKLGKYSSVPRLSHDDAWKFILKFYSQEKLNELRFGRKSNGS